MNIKDQIKTLEKHIYKLMIIEKSKHLYFINIYFKNNIYKTTTEKTRERYIKEFIKNSLSNYIIIKHKQNNKESYKILINNYKKELIIKLCLKLTDSIATAYKEYIESKNKNEKNLKFYLTKLLNHKPKFIIQNNLNINKPIYSKSNDFNNLYLEYKKERNNLKKELLRNQLNNLIDISIKNYKNIYKTKTKYYKYEKPDFNIHIESNIKQYNLNIRKII